MERLYAEDFNTFESNPDGEFVRISELNEMIKFGAIKIDRQKIEEYKFDTRVVYDTERYSREEAMKVWYGE